jgi:hypothetical protein
LWKEETIENNSLLITQATPSSIINPAKVFVGMGKSPVIGSVKPATTVNGVKYQRWEKKRVQD